MTGGKKFRSTQSYLAAVLLCWICVCTRNIETDLRAVVLQGTTEYQNSSVGDPLFGGEVSRNTSGGQNSAAICAILKDSLRYIDEWIIYNFAVGFDKIYIYDNTNIFELFGWYKSQSKSIQQKVSIQHFPGFGQQKRAYNDCWENIRGSRSHSWIAFFDIDEFVVIRNRTKYPFIMDLLDSLPQHFPALAINWVLFLFNNQSQFINKPVTLRFQRRDHGALDPHVKIIVRAHFQGQMRNAHSAGFSMTNTSRLLPRSRDSRGKKVIGPFNKDLQDSDIALYHFYTKSLEEFKERCTRGRVSVSPDVQNKSDTLFCQPSEKILKVVMDGKNESVWDNSPWQILQERAPFYTEMFTFQQR